MQLGSFVARYRGGSGWKGMFLCRRLHAFERVRFGCHRCPVLLAWCFLLLCCVCRAAAAVSVVCLLAGLSHASGLRLPLAQWCSCAYSVCVLLAQLGGKVWLCCRAGGELPGHVQCAAAAAVPALAGRTAVCAAPLRSSFAEGCQSVAGRQYYTGHVLLCFTITSVHHHNVLH